MSGLGKALARFDFLRALARVDPDMAINIEHEHQELDQLEGLRSAAETSSRRRRKPNGHAVN